ncbi:ribosomal large subunit pseudouridine synthase B [Frankia casuarinae]|uniref:Pseudouridine synthase n=1 Tax=Frankia casuarinae (strain DSM 45818 / CECT 9043 / HFP020203 / CcI3) TaxID=106370 RepID=Q2JD11_FRACC|nr:MULTISPECIES: pseudouridine synthase [Frankia]ABD10831.1 ribosomal large subunit pseudouridine synthase B [Frankia casuarinae]EYT92895.1 ribosomal large subunit pseudouridine synthase B [Frankia casuarinae]KEZ37605.1 ribosomal large subunit pseudouridine synthase B [Frankia sp. CeD]ORT95363.1 MFS transporter [Frankia casuarinae]TFE34874.1 rRNA pseudouridine synthase [Frankia sp. B2]
MSSGDRPDGPQDQGIRLQKVLAAAGVGSRRHGEELIAAGRVRVDGTVVREQGRRVDPETALIEVDGERIVTRTGLVHLALNKPRGVLSAMSDDRGRPTIADLLTEFGGGLFHVGRLDADSEGLLLVTNDGELAHRLTHPSFAVPKTYLVEVSGPLRRDVLRQLRAEVELDDGPVRADSARIVDNANGRVMVEVVVHEGRKHVVRRMMDAVGHPVHRLVRTRFGAVSLGTLRAGRARHLTRHEIGALYHGVGL